MSKPDWGSLQQQFIAAHSRTGISPAGWCEEHGLNYATARRYIKKPPKSAQVKLRNSAQKTAQTDGAQTAQKRATKSAGKNPEKFPQKIIPEKLEEIFNPDDFGITGQQGKFAEFIAEGKKLADAYRLAGYSDVGHGLYANASRLMRNDKVSRAIRWLRDRRQRRLALTEQEIIHQLSSIASADPNRISQIRRVNCRYCWGDDHQYQWRDVDEYERACAKALIEKTAPPAFDGGIGFVDTTIPNEDCPRCNGDGQMELFFADTSMLDGPERWLVTGVEETMNGLKVKMASPEAARKELMAYIKATRRVIPGDGEQPATDKETLELKGLELRNAKLEAEIENIRNGKQESNLVVVHNALQVPGAVQPLKTDEEGGG